MSYMPGSRRKISSILPKLIVKIVGILSAVTIIIGLFLAYLDHGINIRSLKDKARTNADYFAVSLSYPVWNLVYREINTQLEGFFIDPEAFSVSLAIEGLDDGLIQLTRDEDWRPVFGAVDPQESVISEFRDIIANEEVIATLEIKYTPRFAKSKIRAESIILMVIVLIIDGIIIITLFVILRIDVFRPLRLIERWAAGVSSGNDAEDLTDVLFFGEINSLNTSIDRMKIQLEERIRLIAVAERKYRALFVSSPVATWELDFSTIIGKTGLLPGPSAGESESIRTVLYHATARSANPVALSLLGVNNAESSLSRLIDGADQDTLSVFADELSSLRDKGSDVDGAGGISLDSGEKRFFIYRFASLQGVSNPSTRVLLAALDVTEQVQAYNKLQAALNQKEILAGELFHRIGNTLQLVESLIYLREGRSDDVAAELKGIRLRIQTITAAQNKLYESEDLSMVNLGSLFKELAFSIIAAVNGNNSAIQISVDMDETNVLIDVAVPLALAFGELVSNTAKYAFPDNKKGIFSVSLKRNDENQIVLLVIDDGVGPPPAFNPLADRTMGLSIVSELIEGQLGGRIEFDFSSGFAVKILFNDTVFHRRV